MQGGGIAGAFFAVFVTLLKLLRGKRLGGCSPFHPSIEFSLHSSNMPSFNSPLLSILRGE